MGLVFQSLLGALVGVALAACASTSALEPQNQPLSARAGRIYILRMPAVQGGMHMAAVKINGVDVGAVANNSYLFVDRPPGRYKINTAVFGELEHDVDVEAGRTYYFAINVVASAAPLGRIMVPMDASNAGRPLTKPNMFTNPTWLSEVDASSAPAIMAQMKAPK